MMDKLNVEGLEFINHDSKAISNGKSRHGISVMKVETYRCIYFTAAAARQFNMVHGKFAHFAKHPDGRYWYMVINDDSRGFVINNTDGENSAVRLWSESFVTLFRKETKAKIGDKFFMLPTNHSYKGYQVVEIMTNRPVDKNEMKKQRNKTC